MPRIEEFSVVITTGRVGTHEKPRFSFNGFECQFEEPTGGTGAAERFGGPLRSAQRAARGLFLSGPEEGTWEIASIEIHYELSDGEAYDIRLGEVMLDATNGVNLWRRRPQPSFDV